MRQDNIKAVLKEKHKRPRKPLWFIKTKQMKQRNTRKTFRETVTMIWKKIFENFDQNPKWQNTESDWGTETECMQSFLFFHLAINIWYSNLMWFPELCKTSMFLYFSYGISLERWSGAQMIICPGEEHLYLGYCDNSITLRKTISDWQ